MPVQVAEPSSSTRKGSPAWWAVATAFLTLAASRAEAWFESCPAIDGYCGEPGAAQALNGERGAGRSPRLGRSADVSAPNQSEPMPSSDGPAIGMPGAAFATAAAYAPKSLA